MMAFGEQKAAELRLECWTEGSEAGRFLYENFGYRVLLKYTVSPTKAEECDEWRKLTHELTPQLIYAMWKPAGDTFDEETVMPWDLGSSPAQR